MTPSAVDRLEYIAYRNERFDLNLLNGLTCLYSQLCNAMLYILDNYIPGTHNHNKSNLHVFSVVYQLNYFIFLQCQKISVSDHSESVVAAILEIT